MDNLAKAYMASRWSPEFEAAFGRAYAMREAAAGHKPELPKRNKGSPGRGKRRPDGPGPRVVRPATETMPEFLARVRAQAGEDGHEAFMVLDPLLDDDQTLHWGSAKQRRDAVIALASLGAAMSHIAGWLGINYQMVCKDVSYGRDLGLLPPDGTSQRVRERRERIIELLASGVSRRALPKMLGVSAELIRLDIKRLRRSGRLPGFR